MNYVIRNLPLSKEDFNAMLPEMCKDPMGAVAACVCALNIITQDRSQGRESLRSMNPDISRSTLQLAENQLRSKPYLIRSYFKGTTPANGYALPEKLEMEFSKNRYSGSEDQGKIKLFIACSGADSPRPVTLKKRKDNSWYAHEWSSLVVGIRPPS